MADAIVQQKQRDIELMVCSSLFVSLPSRSMATESHSLKEIGSNTISNKHFMAGIPRSSTSLTDSL